MTGSDDLPDTDALLDALRTNGQALQLTDDGRTAFAAFDPEASENEREAFYWYEYDRSAPARTASDDMLSTGDLTFRIGAWTVDGLVASEEMAVAIVDSGPQMQWFWARSPGSLEDQLQDHYHSGLYIANKDALVSPDAESFTVEETLCVGNMWPEAHDRGDEWESADHNDRTATTDPPTFSATVFYETTVCAGGGWYVVALPRRDLFREKFAQARPYPDESTRACASCRRIRPESARFCDWCGATLRDPPAPTRRERAVARISSAFRRGFVSRLRARVRGLISATDEDPSM